MSLPAKIIICCDGTSNSEFIEANPLTNVSRIARCIPPVDKAGGRQIVYYRSGIGTDDGDSIKPIKGWHQAMGSGLDRIILEAYSFLCYNYRDEPSDKIFLIGFSRGAFAVRCLADFIHQKGILPKLRLHQAHRLFREWRDGAQLGNEEEPTPPGHRPRITACAVWDTVSSVAGGPTFVNADPCPSVDYFFQALALHEHRYYFPPIVPHTDDVDLHLDQCWFAGYHADIGGGNKEDALAHFALIWVVSKLNGLGFIEFDEQGLVGDSLPNDTWKISSPNRLPIEDPKALSLHYKSWAYAASFSQFRIPQIHLWNENGEHRENGHFSGEKMHSTARCLRERGLFNKQCYAADGVDPPQPEQFEQKWRWNLRRRVESWVEWLRPHFRHPIPNDIGGNIIEEESLDTKEKDLLKAWVNYDHYQYDDAEHPPDEPRPKTILVDLKEWLGKHD